MYRRPYLVSLHRAGSVEEYEVWMRSLSESLPRFLVPLRGSHPAVVIDLQEALNRAYDEGAYGRTIDYASHPDPPLSAEETEWARTLFSGRTGAAG